MGFDQAWETAHQQQAWGRWPETNLVRFMARAFPLSDDIKPRMRVLDLGCGAGASSWFLRKEGFDVRAVDGSQRAVEKTNTRMIQEGLTGPFFDVRVHDLSKKLPWHQALFDCVIDIATIECLPIQETAMLMHEIRRVLKPGGWFFSIMASEHCSPEIHKVGTVRNIASDHLAELIGHPWDNFTCEHESRSDRGLMVAHWIIAARKPLQ